MTPDFDRVTADGVSQHFGRRRALSQVAFTCEAGQVVGLLGPNGAGKSTLLAILSTLVRPSAGLVRYGDLTAESSGPALRRRLGWLGHDLQLYPELTARENLGFFARLQQLDRADARVHAALATAALDTRGDDLVSGFSRGMRQRLALERALIHEPRLLLLDEPFTGLDQTSTVALIARLRRLAGNGVLVIVATHDLDLVDGLLDRALLLRDGRLTDLVPGGDGWRGAYLATVRGPA